MRHHHCRLPGVIRSRILGFKVDGGQIYTCSWCGRCFTLISRGPWGDVVSWVDLRLLHPLASDASTPRESDAPESPTGEAAPMPSLRQSGARTPRS